VIAFSRLVKASSSANVQGRVGGTREGTVEGGGTRGRDSDDIFSILKNNSF
jgi:hypothetical protein